MPDRNPDSQPERQRPAVSILDVITLAPIETYAILVDLAGSNDPVVITALSSATRRVLMRTRAG